MMPRTTPRSGGLLTVAPPLSPTAFLPLRRRPLPFPLDDPGHRRYALGRHGLFEGLRALGFSVGDEVLVPAWHHGSEVEAIVRAGLVPRFHEATEGLSPDPTELETLIGPRVRALHLIHYLGIPQDSPRWRAWCDARGLALVEDAAQAWLSTIDGRPSGSFGDLAIFSLYKTDGFPDGGAAIGPPAMAVPRHGPVGALPAVRRVGALIAGRMAWLTPFVGPRRGAYDPARDFALGRVDGPSLMTSWALRRAPTADTAARRRDHYRYLLDRLGDLVPAPFGEIPDGASPFAFPVRTDDKPGLLARLERHAVRGTNLWSVPHPSLDATAFPRAAARRATTVILPVHQHLRHEDLDRIVRAVLTA
jgi:hypothetical protein